MRVVRAFTAADGSALVHLHNVSGGVLGGDQLWVEADVKPNARAQITTTGATRVYRQRADGATTVQVTRFTVQQGAMLEYLPDMLIPFANARYQQATRIELGPDAGLFYWEVVAPGREAKQELFEYDWLRLDLDILTEQRPLAVERVQLEPKRRPVTSFARLGHYRYYGTFYICRVGIAPARWLALETELTALANQLTVPSEIVWGVSTLAAHGLVVRVVSRTNRLLTPMLPHFWQLAKQALYQAEAIMPRKIY
ncbi:urease accessory protein UreD [soil metagenome]